MYHDLVHAARAVIAKQEAVQSALLEHEIALLHDALNRAEREENRADTIDLVRFSVRALSPAERLAVFEKFCTGCGGECPCYCENDE